MRFELTDPCESAVFKTAGLNRSPKPPEAAYSTQGMRVFCLRARDCFWGEAGVWGWMRPKGDCFPQSGLSIFINHSAVRSNYTADKLPRPVVGMSDGYKRNPQ